jgi:hypothetical protein
MIMETISKNLLLELLSNKELKKDFLKDPKKVLKDKGIKVDESVNYKVVEDTPTTKHVVIPYLDPIDPDKLEDFEKRLSKIVIL